MSEWGTGEAMEKEGKERERESESWNRGVVSAVAREVRWMRAGQLAVLD